MSYIEELQSQFASLNVSNIDQKILLKCEDLCVTYSLEPEDFMDLWLAYSASKTHELAPSLDALDRLERHELQKQQKSLVRGTPNRPNVETTPVRTPVRKNLQEEMLMESPQRIEISHTVPSESFINRSGAGTVVTTFGDCANSFKGRSSTVRIKVQNSVEKGSYMYERFLAKRGALNEIARWVISDICHHHNLELSPEKPKQYSGEMVICGRICCDNLTKLDPLATFLEGLVDIYKGQAVKLSLKNVEKARLFRGQSVVLVGNNMKDWFTVKEVFSGAPLPPSPSPNNPEPLQIIVASGPFTLQENLLYEPLEQLLAHVEDTKPNVLILMGPFLDGSHPHLEDFTDSYDNFFETIVEGIMHRLQGTGVQVVLVPSTKDIYNHIVFPSLPYKLKKRYENLVLAPNPFVLDIDGVIVSGSTADILFHLSKVEYYQGAYEDRMRQLVMHIFNQRSFYPLSPPDGEIRVDNQLLEQVAMFEQAPHVMILPSNLIHFIKNVQDCVVVNPERLTKGNRGTFAKIEIGAVSQGSKVCEKVSCEIRQI